MAPGILILTAVLLNIAGRVWQGFSNFYVNCIFPLWVETYGRVTGVFSFSVGEWMLYLAVVLTSLLLTGGAAYGIFRKRRPRRFEIIYRKYALFYYWVFGIVCVIMTLNCFLLYQASPITERYQIGEGKKKDYGVEEIAALRDYVVEQANRLAPVFERDAQGYLVYEGNFEEEARAQIEYGLSRCDILKIADNELEFMTGETDFDRGAAILRNKYPNIRLFNVTAGADGSYSYYEDKRVFVPACKLGGVIETTGAGDTFCACVLNFALECGLEGLTEKDLGDMLSFANAAAYLVTTRKGAIRSMPERGQVEALLRMEVL